MTGAKLPMHIGRPQGATLCKVRSLKYTKRSHRSKRRSFLYYKKGFFGNVIRAVEALKLGSRRDGAGKRSAPTNSINMKQNFFHLYSKPGVSETSSI